MTETVYIIDADREVRLNVYALLTAHGYICRSFATGSDFLEESACLTPGLILVCLEGAEADGFQLLDQLGSSGPRWPVIMISDGTQVVTAVSAMKRGAVDVVEDVGEGHALINAVQAASGLLKARVQVIERATEAQRRVDALSERELLVFRGILAGMSNKAIAAHLHLSVRTVEMHRQHIFDELRVESVAAAVYVAVEAGLVPLDKAA